MSFLVQQYYEKLSSKARGKPRSPSRSSSSEEDLGQRLEAKLLAAEQKRYIDVIAVIVAYVYFRHPKNISLILTINSHNFCF